MPIRGDWARLEATKRGLRKLAHVPAQISTAGSLAIKSEIDKSFATETDPYGKAWEPLASATIKRWGAHPILRLTGSGASEITVRPLPGAGITVDSPSLGLAFAQGGTANEPVRRFLPVDQFPKSWREALEASATGLVKEALSGVA